MRAQCTRTRVQVIANQQPRRNSAVEVWSFEPRIVKRRRTAQTQQRFVNCGKSHARPRRVIHLQRLPRLARFRIPLVVCCAVEGNNADVVHLHVVGVRIPALIVVVRNQHMRALATNDAHQPAHCFIEVGHVKTIGVIVCWAIQHSRIAISKHFHMMKTNDLRGLF